MRVSMAKLCLITVFATLTGLQADGGSSSVTSRVGVTILAPNQVVRGEDFSFAPMSRTSPSRIQITSQGTHNLQGSVQPEQGNHTAAATVQLRGMTDTISVGVPQKVTLVSADGKHLTAEGFHSQVSTSLRHETQTIRLGASLNVPPATTGRYQGTMDVTLAYN